MAKKNTNEKQDSRLGSSGWKLILQTLFSNAAERVGENFNKKKEIIIKNAKKMILGSFLASVGFIFLSIGVIILINSLLGNRWPFAGWAAVGIIVLVWGYAVGRKQS